MSFGGKISKLRAEKGLSRKQLAEKAGISEVSLGRYERGIVKAPQDKNIYAKLAEALGCSREYLMGGIDDKKSISATRKKVSQELSDPTDEADKIKPLEKPKRKNAKALRDETRSASAAKKGWEKAYSASEPPVTIELQYGGRSVSYDELVQMARNAADGRAGSISLYVKPEEGKAYFVAGEESGSFEL